MTSRKMPPPPADSTDANLREQLSRERALAKQRARRLLNTRPQHAPRDVLAHLVTSAIELQTTSHEIAAAGAQLEASMAEIAATARSASASVSKSRAGVSLIQQASRDSQARTQAALKQARQVERLVAHTVDAVRELATSIVAARATNEASSANVLAVRDQSSEIRHIASTVIAIAEQINLFAFNAALEASRAGAHGVSFSIVADEVRLLAQRASGSAQDIDEVMKNIEAAVWRVSENMSEALRESAAWVDDAQSIVDALQRCNELVGVVLVSSTDIDVHSRELTLTMEKTEETSVNLSKTTQNTENSSHASLGVLAEQTRALRKIQGIAETLALKTEQAYSFSQIDEGEASEGETSEEGGEEATPTQRHSPRTMLLEEMSILCEELSTSAQQSAQTSAHLSASVDQIVGDTQRLEHHCQENLPNIKRAATNVREMGLRANLSKTHVTQLSEALQNTMHQIEALISKVNTTAEHNIEYSQGIKEFQTEVLRIDEIIDALLSISVMTNLLSVFGRIEGARVGDAGVGFNNVSEDIRQLAEDTNNSVTSARRLIRAIQLSIATVVSDLERAGLVIRSEVDRARRITNQLGAIELDVRATLKSVSELTILARDASENIPEVRQGLEVIADAAHSTRRASLEAASASREQTHAVAELANAIDDMVMQLTFLRS